MSFVIFRFWKPFITFKIFEKEGYPVCGLALFLFNTTNFWKPCKTFKIFDTFWKYLTTSVSGLDVYELHIQKVSKYFFFCRQRYELVFKTYDTPISKCLFLSGTASKMIEFRWIIENHVENWYSTKNLYLQKHILKLRNCETRLEIVYVAINIFSSKIFN